MFRKQFTHHGLVSCIITANCIVQLCTGQLAVPQPFDVLSTRAENIFFLSSIICQLLVEENGSTRTLILNRPKQLNALSSAMIKGLLRCFVAYEEEDGVKLLIMKVSLLTGIVMGGGAGVSLHGRFRVATDKTVFAMPETALGLFPDVGASYFLSRLPGFYGEYVALAGARLDGAEMLACGLATHFVRSNRLALLEESLKKLDTSNTSAVCGIINQFAEKPPLKENSSLNRLEIINKCFSKRTVEEIISALEQVASNLADEWVVVTIQSLKKASPTSLKISLRSIREGRTETIGECLRREYRIVCHVLQGDFSKDFYEGSRALLIDKDQNPRWMPPRLEQVDDEAVEQYFSRMDDPWCEDLNLPTRRYNGINTESKL
ncbi:hypothetical protein SEVIR_8G183300v4 [Setaria viridis]